LLQHAVLKSAGNEPEYLEMGLRVRINIMFGSDADGGGFDIDVIPCFWAMSPL
jgi:hypothetical protein